MIVGGRGHVLVCGSGPQKHEQPRDFLRVIREVFAGRQRCRQALNLARRCQFQRRHHGLGQARIVDGHRGMVGHLQIGPGLIGTGNALNQRRHFFLDGVADRRAVAADGPGEFDCLRDDVAGRAAIDGADTDHGHALAKVRTATHQGLQSANDGAAGNNRINPAPGCRAMGLLTVHGDAELIAAVKYRSGFVIQVPGRVARHHVNPEHGFNLGRVQCTVTDHGLGTDQRIGLRVVHIGGAFFGRLEQEHHRTGHLVPMLGQYPGCAQQHGGMGVMPTGMHDRHGFT